jgi:hypothetical protein
MARGLVCSKDWSQRLVALLILVVFSLVEKISIVSQVHSPLTSVEFSDESTTTSRDFLTCSTEAADLNGPRVAYVTLSYGDLVCPSLAATFQFHKVISSHSKYSATTDVVLMRLGAPIQPQFIPYGVQQRMIQETSVKASVSGWLHTFAKFRVASWYEYDVVVFLDSDVLLYKPLDDLVDQILNEEEPGSMMAPRVYWSRQQPAAMLGTFLMRPTNVTSGSKIVVTKKLEEFLEGHNETVVAGRGDMHWFNKNDLLNHITLVHGWYALLVGEFYAKDGAFRKIGDQYNMTPAEVLQKATLIHFIARWKPWKKGIDMANGFVNDELRKIYNDWANIWDQACPVNATFFSQQLEMDRGIE